MSKSSNFNATTQNVSGIPAPETTVELIQVSASSVQLIEEDVRLMREVLRMYLKEIGLSHLAKLLEYPEKPLKKEEDGKD